MRCACYGITTYTRIHRKLGPCQRENWHTNSKNIGAIVAGLGGQLSDLILVNAIQYQCSLGLPTHRYRDRVFKSLWENGGAVDFKQRLKLIYRPHDMLLNCCTGTEPLIGRRQLVTAAIRNSLGSVALYSGPHPFSWISEPNRMAVTVVVAKHKPRSDPPGTALIYFRDSDIIYLMSH